MRVLIIEDEKPASGKLVRLLGDLNRSVEVVDVLSSVEDSINWFQKNPLPDLILMDVQLEDGICFDIFESVRINVPVIFITAYDQYSLKAFKVNSVDYLLKPINREELKKAFDKFEQVHYRKDNFQKIESVLKQLQNGKKERFLVKVGDHFKSLLTSNVNYFFIEERCTFISTGEGKNYGIDYSLEKIEELVDPNQFFRVNRNYIVNFSSIADIVSYSSSRLKIKLRGLYDDNYVLVSRERVSSFKVWMDR